MSDPRERLRHLSPLKQAILALSEAQERVRKMEGALHEPIAVVGMACRLPGSASDPESFWALLHEGRCAVGEIPVSRWDANAFYDPVPGVKGKSYSKWGGFIDEVDRFDAHFFGISPREAVNLDPQQRILLEVTFEALEAAGLPPDSLRGTSTGVFLGINTRDYLDLQTAADNIDAYVISGSAFNSTAAGRVSYTLGTLGPSIAIDTACSSSLVAVHLACQSLRVSETDVAIAAGVNLILSPYSYIYLSQARTLSPGGLCKTFDAEADGYVRGEGCGVVVLRRLSDARSAGDPILAIIRGTASNHDGPSTGYTVPSGAAQQALVRSALRDAGLKPAAIDYVETHGTGTSLGDPIEARALGSVFKEGRDKSRPLLIGSVKTNIGHLEAAAGIAGLIKVILALRHKEIPPSINVSQPSPHIEWDELLLDLPREPIPWETNVGPCLAGVSSFGLSGANAHVIVEESAEIESPRKVARAWPNLLVLSAHTSEALRDKAQSFVKFLNKKDDNESTLLGDICYTAAVRRSHYRYRLAALGQSLPELRDGLAAFLRDESDVNLWATSVPSQSRRVLFVFSGQGAQSTGMCRSLFESNMVFRESFEKCASIFTDLGHGSLLEELLKAGDETHLDRIDVVQPLLFSIGYSIARVWLSWGVRPYGVIGHSMGEVLATCVAGALTLEDAARVISARSRLLARVAGRGGMLIVELPEAEAARIIEAYGDRVCIGAVNSPRSTVLSGCLDALEQISQEQQSRGVFCRFVKSLAAGHSAQMDGLLDELKRELAYVKPQSTATLIYSTVTACAIDGARLDAAYWARNLREPVLFHKAMGEALREGESINLEIGPHPVLLPSVEESIKESGSKAIALASMRRQEPEQLGLARALAKLYTEGVAIDWVNVFAERGKCVALPKYAWQHERFWIDGANLSARQSPALPGDITPSHSLLRNYLQSSLNPDTHFWETEVDTEHPGYLTHHRVNGTPLFPAAAFLEMVFSAAAQILGDGAFTLEHVEFREPLILPTGKPVRAQMAMTITQPGSAKFQFASWPAGPRPSGDSVTTNVTGSLKRKKTNDHRDGPQACPVEAELRSNSAITAEAFYEMLTEKGYGLGGCFRNVSEVHYSDERVYGRIEASAEIEADRTGYCVHPAFLDSCFQVIGAAMSDSRGGNWGGPFVPVRIEKLDLFCPMPSSVWSEARLREGTDLTGELAVADLIIRDQSGHPVMEARGIHLKAISPPAERQAPDWFYEPLWCKDVAPEQPSRNVASDHAAEVVVFVRKDDTGKRLVERLRHLGLSCISVIPADSFEKIGTDCYQACTTSSGSIDELLSELFQGQRRIGHILFAWAIGLNRCSRIEDLKDAQDQGIIPVLHIVQSLVRLGLRDSPRLWLLTSGVQTVELSTEELDMQAATLWGLARVIAHEHPDLCCTVVDIAINPDDLDSVVDSIALELQAGSDEDQLVLRRESRYVSRLKPIPARELAETTRLSVSSERAAGEDAIAQLWAERPGRAEDLAVRHVARKPVGREEIEIRVEAAGLNFSDILKTLGLYAGQRIEHALGVECVGAVTAVGAAVEDFCVGDRVMAFGRECFSDTVTVPACYAARIPQGVEFTEAATVPAAFLTAYHALVNLARLQSGERVLIHTASGGVGLAALQLARLIGAEVYATAGTAEKRAFLRQHGVYLAMDSRSLSFADKVMEATGGEGVDVVLNTLAGEAVRASLMILRGDGRFIELGRRDIYRGSPLSMELLKPNRTFHAVDLDEAISSRAELIKQTFKLVVNDLESGRIHPLPNQVFPVVNFEDAFRIMSRSEHIGKLVFSFNEGGLARRAGRGRLGELLSADASYLITGGLGGIGFATAEWLAQQGVARLVLVGRRHPDQQLERKLAEMRESGAQVEALALDVSIPENVERAIAIADDKDLPLRGIIHCAGTVADATILQMSREQFLKVLEAKVYGAWNLHTATVGKRLDFFILFSSGASLLGSPGQSNHASANSFLDALAHHRHALRLPALTLNWGPWSGAGQAFTRRNRGERFSHRGISAISVEEGINVLCGLLDERRPQMSVLPLNFAQWRQFYPQVAKSPYFQMLAEHKQEPRVPAETELVRELRIAGAGRSKTLLEQFLRKQLGHVLRLDVKHIEADLPFHTLGLDSLMALELRNQIEVGLGIKLPATIVWTYNTVSEMVAHLIEALGLSDSTSDAPVPSAIPKEPSGSTRLSSEETHQLLEDELRAIEQEYGY